MSNSVSKAERILKAALQRILPDPTCRCMFDQSPDYKRGSENGVTFFKNPPVAENILLQQFYRFRGSMLAACQTREVQVPPTAQPSVGVQSAFKIE